MSRRRRRNDSEDGLASLIALAALYLWFKIGTTGVILILGSVFILAGGGIFIVYRRRKQKLLDSGIHVIDNMTGQMFEELILEHFKKLGYKGRMTATTADYGADLILENGQERIVAQLKRWKQQVGIEAVQQAVASIKHYNANRGMVITNSFFTPNAKELARTNNIELWDREKLIGFLSRARGKEVAATVVAKQTSATACPSCGSHLVLRSGKRGKFWGCSSFPKCKFTKDFDS